MSRDTRTPSTYGEAVRTFDHAHLAALPAYTALRQALSDLANEAPPTQLGRWLAAIADMAATAPYADLCETCTVLRWPHAVRRDGNWLTCSYRCPCGRTWTCGYAADFAEWH